MIRINLIAEGRKATPGRLARARAFRLTGDTQAVWILVVSFFVIALGYGGYWFIVNRQLAAQREEIAAAEATVRELEEIIREVERYEAEKAALEHKIQVISNLRNSQRGPLHIMDEVSKALPDFLWLDQLNMSASTVSIRGKAFTTSSVANFIENLDLVAEFQEPVLRNATWRGQVYDFQISFNYAVVPVNRPEEEATADEATAEEGAVPPATSQREAAR